MHTNNEQICKVCSHNSFLYTIKILQIMTEKAGLMMHGHGKQISMIQVKKMKITILMTGSNHA